MNNLAAFGIEAGKGKYHEEAFYGLILVNTVLFDRMSQFLAEYGLTPAKMNVLMVIKHQGKETGLSQREIGQRLMVTPSNMTRMLEKLEREKMIERSGLDGDKRVKVIRISQKGSHVLDEAWPGYLKTMHLLMGKVSASKQKVLAEILIEWFDALKV